MKKYNLNFISDKDLYHRVKKVINEYKLEMDLQKFNSNLIDPIKLTFDSKVYKMSNLEIVDVEVARQKDKTVSNSIGYFHQNMFKHIINTETKSSDWTVPKKGFDIINQKEKIFVEMKNKHNTMNSSSSQKTYNKMQDKLSEDNQNRCYLVEVISKNSQNIVWKIKVDGKDESNENIRRISIDKFYEIVTGEKESFKQLVETIPIVMDDILKDDPSKITKNNVYSELLEKDENIIKSLHFIIFWKIWRFQKIKI